MHFSFNADYLTEPALLLKIQPPDFAFYKFSLISNARSSSYLKTKLMAAAPFYYSNTSCLKSLNTKQDL